MPRVFTAEDERALQEHFDSFGKERGLDKEDVMKLLQLMGQNPTPASVDQVFIACNGEAYGVLSFYDIKNYLEREGLQAEHEEKESLLKAFKTIDKNGNNYVTHEELRNYMANYGDRMQQQEIEDFIDFASLFDYNKDGKYNYEKMCEHLTSQQQ